MINVYRVFLIFWFKFARLFLSILKIRLYIERGFSLIVFTVLEDSSIQGDDSIALI